jgi:glycosyltransferase involved in cell wall biosynthesis
LKTAIVHDWLVTYAGSERVLEQILLCYPDADLFAIVDFIPEKERGFLLGKEVKTSFIQRLPFANNKYRNYLPLMPLAVKRFDLSKYDFIISSSHAVAKGVSVGPSQIHICYCHTPMRYIWDLKDQYLKASGLNSGVKGVAVKFIFKRLRVWDVKTALTVDSFIANSIYIQERIKRIYKRDSIVIYPPVDIEKFELNNFKEDFFVTASRMVPYKKIDLIVEAFSNMPEKRLVVIGDGPDFNKVRLKAGKNIELLGHQTDRILKDYFGRAKAFVFAAEEDFGIAPVEAQACGTPVIAYGKGGAVETVVDGKTGILFREQSVQGVIDAVSDFETRGPFDFFEIRKNAERFSETRFREEFKAVIEQTMNTEMIKRLCGP